MATHANAAETFITLCYHDIPQTAVEKDDISEKDFVNQIEYLRSSGFTFISAGDVLRAARGQSALPDKAVLLTFDDAYASFYRFVYPFLRLQNIPAVLSVVTSWIDNPEMSDYRTKQFMTWKQLREVSDSGLVTVASHSDRLHRLVQVNPVGNIEPAPSAFLYFPDRGRYETEQEFRERVRTDLSSSIEALSARLGKRPVILTWPYGSYNAMALEEAKGLGFEMVLTLDDGYSSVRRLDRVNRYYLETRLDWLAAFKESLRFGLMEQYRMRAVQLDLDIIVDRDSAAESDRNLGLLLDRLVAMGVNTVFLQGFCDLSATGNVSSLYFANSVLPVEMDFLSHAVNRIRSREMKVFVWMPALAYELPDRTLNESLKVREWAEGGPTVTASWYRRLSPFDSRTHEAVRRIFADLSARVAFDGILIQDDAYLADTEDYHPAAVDAFRKQYGKAPEPALLKADPDLALKWSRFKTDALDGYVAGIAKTVRAYRPGAVIARNIYAPAVTDAAAGSRFSQDLKSYLRDYDYTVVMAYDAMENVKDRRAWFRRLFKDTGGEAGADRVVFKLQAYDWETKRWVDDERLKDDLTFLLSLGVRHVAYYPDDVYDNRPRVETLASILSSKEEVKRRGLFGGAPSENFFQRLFRKLFPAKP